jgi:hypothetical protein
MSMIFLFSFSVSFPFCKPVTIILIVEEAVVTRRQLYFRIDFRYVRIGYVQSVHCTERPRPRASTFYVSNFRETYPVKSDCLSIDHEYGKLRPNGNSQRCHFFSDDTEHRLQLDDTWSMFFTCCLCGICVMSQHITVLQNSSAKILDPFKKIAILRALFSIKKNIMFTLTEDFHRCHWQPPSIFRTGSIERQVTCTRNN